MTRDVADPKTTARRRAKLERIRELARHVHRQAANVLADLARDDGEDLDLRLSDLVVESANFAEMTAARAEEAIERLTEVKGGSEVR